MADKIEIVGVDEVLARMNSVMTSHPDMRKQLQTIVRAVLRKATSKVRQTAKGQMGSDPRKAYQAVKSMVYKRIFGGNINIISPRRAGKFRASLPPQKQQTGRGGNRRARSKRTEDVMSYWGKDRAFILRWLNAGTSSRSIETSSGRSGNRGRIAARFWFGQASTRALEEASVEITTEIEKYVEEIWATNSK